MSQAVPSKPPRGRAPLAWIAGFLLICALSAVYPPLAVPGVALTLVLGLSFPWSEAGNLRTLGVVAIVLSGVGATFGLGRFAMSKAMLGIVEGGQSAAAYSALWRLREVVIAEDGMRSTAPEDPDGDHVGSAELIGALAGTAPLRNGKRLDAPLLNYAFRAEGTTALGPVARVEGYLLVVCLPTSSGGWSARPGDAIDEERAERRFVAYAWPSEAAHGLNTVFFTDEHERILVLDAPRGTPAPYLGEGHPPACDAALGADGLAWTAWKHKQPRKTLPGDSPS